MGSVCEVAKYILEQTGEITTMKLQKLVYYSQAWSLVWDDMPLFSEEFEAWANGPVCPQLFQRHRGRFAIDVAAFKDIDYNLTQDEIDTINGVLEYYGDKDSHWLSELTHKERPWKDARTGYAPGEICSNIITKESMQSYYGGL